MYFFFFFKPLQKFFVFFIFINVVYLPSESVVRTINFNYGAPIHKLNLILNIFIT